MDEPIKTHKGKGGGLIHMQVCSVGFESNAPFTFFKVRCRKNNLGFTANGVFGLGAKLCW